MKKSIKTKWMLNKDEVSMSISSGCSFVAKNPVNSAPTKITISLIHNPSKVEVSNSYTGKFLTKKSFQIKKDEVLKELYIVLQNKVAKHLKIPGMC